MRYICLACMDKRTLYTEAISKTLQFKHSWNLIWWTGYSDIIKTHELYTKYLQFWNALLLQLPIGTYILEGEKTFCKKGYQLLLDDILQCTSCSPTPTWSFSEIPLYAPQNFIRRAGSFIRRSSAFLDSSDSILTNPHQKRYCTGHL